MKIEILVLQKKLACECASYVLIAKNSFTWFRNSPKDEIVVLHKLCDAIVFSNGILLNFSVAQHFLQSMTISYKDVTQLKSGMMMLKVRKKPVLTKSGILNDMLLFPLTLLTVRFDLVRKLMCCDKNAKIIANAIYFVLSRTIPMI